MASTVINLTAPAEITPDKVNHIVDKFAWLLFVPVAAAALSVVLAIKSPAFAASIALMGLE